MSIETIYMPLLNEGIDVWARVQAEKVGNGIFRVLGPMPDDQQWSFRPNVVVSVQARTFSGGSQGLVAVAISN